VGNLARAGGLALRSLAYFFSMTVIALALGLIAANVFAPGAGFDADPTASAVGIALVVGIDRIMSEGRAIGTRWRRW
jgi:Na+/H+-dicarboxylate symporter